MIVKKEANLPAFVWAYKVPNVKNPDSAALEVLATILSEGESSRLYRRLVIEKRLLLDVNADNPLLSLDPNLFTVSGQLLPDKKVGEVEAAVEKEIAAIATERVSEHEISQGEEPDRSAVRVRPGLELLSGDAARPLRADRRLARTRRVPARRS